MPKPIEPERYYKPTEVATLLGVTAYTVRDWLNREKLKGKKLPSGHWRIPGQDLIDFLQEEYGNAAV